MPEEDRLTAAAPLHRSHFIFIVLLCIAISLSIFAIWKSSNPRSTQELAKTEESALARIRKEKVLNVGYGLWPPYSSLDREVDPENPSGLSVDLIKEIASRANLEVKFHRFNWNTMRTDLSKETWDVAIEPVFIESERPLNFGFTDSYGRFGIACAIVKKDDERFEDFTDLDREKLKVAVPKGWSSEKYADRHLSKPEIMRVNAKDSGSGPLDEVLFGRADVGLNDSPTVFAFAKEHSDKVKALWLDSPPSSVVGAMLTEPNELELLNFLNNSLRAMKADGTLEALDRKWRPFVYYSNEIIKPGVGVTLESN